MRAMKNSSCACGRKANSLRVALEQLQAAEVRCPPHPRKRVAWGLEASQDQSSREQSRPRPAPPLPLGFVRNRHPSGRRLAPIMGNPLDYAPIAAAAFAIPQFLPQLRKLRATDDIVGALEAGDADQGQQRRLARLLRACRPTGQRWCRPARQRCRRAGDHARPPRSGHGARRPWSAPGPRCWSRPWPSPVAPAWERCLRPPSSSRLPRRSGPPTGPLAPPGSRGAPGCSSSASCRAGPPLACTSPIRALSSSASPLLQPAHARPDPPHHRNRTISSTPARYLDPDWQPWDLGADQAPRSLPESGLTRTGIVQSTGGHWCGR